ncbi:helix-turn-helix transcriptional regulator [uncultured Fretibacterium sp.]|uniref:helix-turn-helix domain-containing protein n=1 Tax=uncultured Fretibacterium sp. TaxID=1678694 RepID=UPI00260273BD|nr:helix-turn-helix transcriptional regulator [uncultured Fretibacterium sp.]
MDFKDRLIQARKLAGMTQYDFCEAVGVSVDTVRRWEAGKLEPTLSKLLRAAEVLKVNVGYLATGKEDEIVLRQGDLSLTLPATSEGFAFVEAKLRELTTGDRSPA